MKLKFRKRLKGWMKKRISFRLHMSLIMISTIFLGMISNFFLLNLLGVTHPGLRYPLTVIFSYCWFLLFIRTYIRHILMASTSSFSVLDFVVTPDSGTGASSAGVVSDAMPWKGEGGAFSGGGATGNWECGEAITDVASEAIKETAGSAVASVVDDEAGLLVTVVIGGAIAAVVFGSGAYFIWHSPEILSECLVQVILVSGMRKRMMKFSEAEWVSHIFKTTKLPFVIVLVFGILSGLFLRAICPEANQLRDYKVKCWKG